MLLEWSGLHVNLRNENKNHNKKHIDIINGISGSVAQGELLAIMGQSGSGKSTLLKALCCRTDDGAHTNGQLSLDGKHIDLKTYVDLVSYVSSKEKSFQNLTVDEIIENTAIFKMPEISRRDINERCNFYKTKLHLHEISGTKFLKLTQSERKRMFIAAALMTEAKMLFIDEPIGEMDSLTAFDVMQTLKYVAVHENKIIVVAIDLPNTNIFNLFDKIQVLYHGKCVYFGSATECAQVFQKFGLERIEKSSDPEYILDIFYRNAGYNEQGKYDTHIQRLIENYTMSTIDEKNTIKSNNGYIRRDFDMNDIQRLLKRRYKGAYTGKLQFIKNFYVRFLFIAICVITLFTTINKRIDNPVQYLPGCNNLSAELQKDEIVIKAAKAYQQSHLVIWIPSILSFFSLYSLISIFGAESVIVKGEISAGFYSIVSYYISALYYEVVMHSLIPILMVSVVLIAFFDICSFNIVVAFILSMLFFAPMILLFGAITFNRKTTLLCASFLILLTTIPQAFIFEHIATFDPKNTLKLNYFKTVYMFLPYCYFTSLLAHSSVYKVKKILGTKLEEKSFEELNKNLNIKLDNILPMFAKYKISFYILLILLLVMIPIYCLITMILLNYKFKPEMRNKFSKKFVKQENESANNEKQEKVASEIKNENLSQKTNNDEVNEQERIESDKNTDIKTKQTQEESAK
ncbi:hypothetical protein BDAP_000197 [Binucleata daphniae]